MDIFGRVFVCVGGAGRANNSALNFFHIMFLDQNQQIEWVVSALQQNIRIYKADVLASNGAPAHDAPP